MANSIAAALKYLAEKLDMEYKAQAKSVSMDVNPAWVRPADVAGTFYLPSISMPGLGDYSTTNGYPAGAVTTTWQAYTYNYDRARYMEVDKVADLEGALVATANMASEFMRMHVIPELDAIRFATVATGADSGNKVQAALTTSAGTIAATNAALVKLAENEVDMGDLLFFATPNVLDLLDSAASTEAKARILSRVTPVEVPPARFSMTVTTNAGASDSAGGFTCTGDDINFILMDRNAAFADAKHVAERFFSPAGEESIPPNPSKNAWRYDYRIVHDCWVYSKKTTGIYVHSENTVS